MNIENVKKLSAEARFLYWITERDKIRKLKEAGDPRPWTDDTILQSYRFCNVRRMDDKVSQWLLNKWYLPNFDHPNMVVACTLARQVNNIDCLREIGFPRSWKPNRVESVIDSRAKRGLKSYSSAYMITANYGSRGREKETKQYQTVWRVCQPVYEANINPRTNTMQECWQSLLKFQGFSSFIAGQVVADLRWAITHDWQDRFTWAPMGPGSKRGLNYLQGRLAEFPLSQEKFLEELQGVIEICNSKLPETITSRLEAMDYQNCLCEYRAYVEALDGVKNPKRRYS